MVGKTTNTKANTFSGFFTAIHSFVTDAAKDFRFVLCRLTIASSTLPIKTSSLKPAWLGLGDDPFLNFTPM